jgi:hypothetical protein
MIYVVREKDLASVPVRTWVTSTVQTGFANMATSEVWMRAALSYRGDGEKGREN